MHIQGSPRKPGKRGKTRSKFKKDSPKVSVNDIMREFAIGDCVQVIIDSSYHSGLPNKSFQGLSGIVVGRRGMDFKIELKKGNQDQIVFTNAVHLKKLEQSASASAAPKVEAKPAPKARAAAKVVA